MSSQNVRSRAVESNKAKRSILPASPEQAIHELIKIIADMQAVFLTETHALECGNAREFSALQDEKFVIIQTYQAAIREIVVRKNEMKDVDPALKDQLKAMQDDFADIASRNMKALNRMKSTASRLGATIMKAVKNTVNKMQSVNYSQSGHLDTNRKRVLPTTISETA